MVFALVVTSMLLNQASIFDDPAPRGEEAEKRGPPRWGGALNVALGAVVYQRAAVGEGATRFDLNVRADVEVRAGPVLLGGFTQLGATLGQDLRLGVGPILSVPFADNLLALVVTPAFYGRHTTDWEPGVSAGLAVLWSYGLGVGVDARLGLGASRERAIVVSGQVDVLRLATVLFMLSWGEGSTSLRPSATSHRP